MNEITPEIIYRTLALELGGNDAGAATVRDYLLRLLHDLWEQGESFDGKRPFGNGAWDAEIYVPMIRAGIITGTLDEDGYIDEMDDIEAEALIFACIASLDNPADLREQLAVTTDMLGVAVNALREIATSDGTASRTAKAAMAIVENKHTGDAEWKLVPRTEDGS